MVGFFFFFFLLLESQGSVPRPGRQKSWGLYRPRVQDVHTFTSSMFYWSKQVWRPAQTQSNEKPPRNCGQIEPTICNTPWHHLEFGSPCSKVLLSHPDHPSFYTDICLFKPSSPWLLHLPTLFLTIFFFLCKYMWLIWAILSPVLIIPSQGVGWRFLAGLKSHNQKEIT